MKLLKEKKTPFTNPELILVGEKCKVNVTPQFVGLSNIDSDSIWVPAKITKVEYDKISNRKIIAITVDINVSRKYKNNKISNFTINRKMFNTINFLSYG